MIATRSIIHRQSLSQGRIKRLGSEAIPGFQPFLLEIKALFQLQNSVVRFEGTPGHGIPPLELLPQVGEILVQHTQLRQRLKWAAPAGHAAHLIVQTAPIVAALFAVGEAVGLGHAPLDQR